MKKRLLKSLPAKIIAIGFILFILFSNFWLTYYMSGAKSPGWLIDLIVGSLIIAVTGGLLLLGVILRLFVNGSFNAEEEPELPDEPTEK